MVAVDSLAYGRIVFVPWNIIKYNIFGGSSRGPDLYGTEPWSFYIANLFINFNIITPLALISLPALFFTYLFDSKRVGGPLSSTSSAEKEKDNALGLRSSPYTLLLIRLAPFYVWFLILTAQAHKEERFFFPAYPFLAFNAAVTIYLMRGWLEAAYIKVTRSPYRASQTSLFQLATLSVVVFTGLVSVSRILAQSYYFHAPLEIVHHLETKELVRVLNVTGFIPKPLPPPPHARSSEEYTPRIDYGPLKSFNITLCLGKEWHRFPSHFLVPDGVNVEFVKSEFDGMLPRHFIKGEADSLLWRRNGTSFVPEDLNDLNKEDPRHYVSSLKFHILLFAFVLNVVFPPFFP